MKPKALWHAMKELIGIFILLTSCFPTLTSPSFFSSRLFDCSICSGLDIPPLPREVSIECQNFITPLARILATDFCFLFVLSSSNNTRPLEEIQCDICAAAALFHKRSYYGNSQVTRYSMKLPTMGSNAAKTFQFVQTRKKT